MADGMEDLREKNGGGNPGLCEKRYDRWRTLQGREDAEMLLEKSAARRAGDARGENGSWGDDDP